MTCFARNDEKVIYRIYPKLTPNRPILGPKKCPQNGLFLVPQNDPKIGAKSTSKNANVTSEFSVHVSKR